MAGWLTPRPMYFTSGKESRYSLCRSLGGPLGRFGRIPKRLTREGPARSTSGCSDYAVPAARQVLIRVIKSRWCVWHVSAWGQTLNAFKILAGKPEETTWKVGRDWIGQDGASWLCPAQDGVRCLRDSDSVMFPVTLLCVCDFRYRCLFLDTVSKIFTSYTTINITIHTIKCYKYLMATCFGRPCDHHQANFNRSCAFIVLTVWDPIMCTLFFIYVLKSLLDKY